MALRRRPARGPAPPAGLEGLLAALVRDQRAAATAPPGPLLVIAGAGAGKTRTLVARAGAR
jgi:DNA helicase-2/ATP-dependent DNA helicase PcrA